MNTDLVYSISEKLQALAEPAYARFQQKLLPGVSGILGVRLPELRALARGIARGDWQAYLDSDPGPSFEETMLRGMTIGYIRADIDTKLALVAGFVPLIDNWSVCDSFCAGLKSSVRAHPERVWSFLEPYLGAQEPFYRRFALAMMTFHFVDERYARGVLARVEGIESSGYYVQMAAAWVVATVFTRFPNQTREYLLNCGLDRFTYRKALSKILESRAVSDADKAMIRTLRAQSR